MSQRETTSPSPEITTRPGEASQPRPAAYDDRSKSGAGHSESSRIAELEQALRFIREHYAMHDWVVATVDEALGS